MSKKGWVEQIKINKNSSSLQNRIHNDIVFLLALKHKEVKVWQKAKLQLRELDKLKKIA